MKPLKDRFIQFIMILSSWLPQQFRKHLKFNCKNLKLITLRSVTIFVLGDQRGHKERYIPQSNTKSKDYCNIMHKSRDTHSASR